MFIIRRATFVMSKGEAAFIDSRTDGRTDETEALCASGGGLTTTGDRSTDDRLRNSIRRTTSFPVPSLPPSLPPSNAPHERNTRKRNCGRSDGDRAEG